MLDSRQRDTLSLTLSFCIVSSLVDSRDDGLWLMRERKRGEWSVKKYVG